MFVDEILTVHGKISQRGTSSSLDLDVGVLKKEENGLKSIAVNSSYVCVIESASFPYVTYPLLLRTAFGDFGKRQTRTSLEVDIV